ncbi:hypothetical protein [Agitococcus lubricus]|uniref:DUF7931 domain-containing protein n=1 Tax=Agitococcus lubricus TaxID=1077255 RepID=A0A2T5IYW7_9GAMM|nr:hypothetical protein [Agitococcus lubricus]PTQ89203.1 hypothetical protein C8N29_10884 [Agitococcus lubricus]
MMHSPDDKLREDGTIDYVPPVITQPLAIIKDSDSTLTPRPTVLFSDEQLTPFILGETENRIELSHLVMLQSAAIALLAQTQREILVISPDLEHERFDNDAFINALSGFSRSSRYTITRILLADPRLAIADGHRLVKLMRKLSSLIEIRQAHEDDIPHLEAVMIADNMGLLRCTQRDPWRGSLLAKGIPYAQQARQRFLEWWERSSEIMDFRELKI